MFVVFIDTVYDTENNKHKHMYIYIYQASYVRIAEWR